MRKLLLAALLMLPLSAAPARASVFDDIDKDKYMHFSAGVLVSHASYPVFKYYFRDRKKAMWCSLGLTALVAVGKELADRNTTGFDSGDLAAGVLGGCTILVIEF